MTFGQEFNQFLSPCHKTLSVKGCPLITVGCTLRSEFEIKQDAIRNGRLLPGCRHLANWTKHIRRLDSGLFTPLYKNMTSSTKREVHNISYCCGRRTQDTSNTATCTENLVNYGMCFLWYPSGQADGQTNKQTDKHTDTLITILRTQSKSASDSFPRFWRYINLFVCMYVCKNSMHGKAQLEPAQHSVVLDCKLVPQHNTCQSLPAVCYITSMR